MRKKSSRKKSHNPVRLTKGLVRKAARFLPPPRGRLTGKLAIHGGRPVRDLRVRPWPAFPSDSRSAWTAQVGRVMGRVFRSGTEGLPHPLAKRFAEEWADYCGTNHALLVPHGTDALRIALATALDHDGLDYGGEVIVPNLSFVASATAALDRRLGVAFVDVDPDTLNIDPRRVEEAIVPGKTRAIMAVHLFGQPADMRALGEIAQRHSLLLIEDAAQAHGAIHQLGRAGGLGDAAGFSFQSSKNLSAGEGGILTTNDSEIFERAYRFHNVGRPSVGGERWVHKTLGWNCRPSEYVAAVLLHRLRSLESQQRVRYARFLALRHHLSDVMCVEPLGIGPGVLRHGVYMFGMRYRSENCGGLQIADFIRAVRAEGVPLFRAHETTLSETPAIQHVAQKHDDFVRAMGTPVADEAVRRLVFIPHTAFLGSESEMAEMAAGFRKVEAHYAPKPAKRSPAVDQRPSAPEGPRDVAGPISVSSGARPIRFGVIGVGLMGRLHAEAITGDPRAALVGVSDSEEQRARAAAEEFRCQWFSTPEELIRSGGLDAVVVATPHWQHVELAIMALRAGLHVVCEKPLAVTVSEADKLVRVASESPGLTAVVHQFRNVPVYSYAKKLLDSGELGAIYRCSFVESAWRTAEYFRASSWRGTWKGEGGGVLLNQAPHLLDRYVWLCGMPETVLARCDTNLHEIETEDTVSAILHHSGGAHGYLHISTVECPVISQTVISCDRGRIIIEKDRLQVTELYDSIRQRTAVDTRLWGDIKNETREILPAEMDPLGDPLSEFYTGFLDTVNGKRDLTSTAEDGRAVVELANAMVLSSARGTAISLPLDRAEYSEFMETMVTGAAAAGLR